MVGTVAEKENKVTTKKKVARKKVTKKAKRPGRPKPKKKIKKRGWPKGKKRGKRVGQPKSIKTAKRPGRPRKKVRRVKVSNSITLPLDRNSDLSFWSELVVYLNKNTGKSFVIQMDGVNYTLHAS